MHVVSAHLSEILVIYYCHVLGGFRGIESASAVPIEAVAKFEESG